MLSARTLDTPAGTRVSRVSAGIPKKHIPGCPRSGGWAEQGHAWGCSAHRAPSVRPIHPIPGEQRGCPPLPSPSVTRRHPSPCRSPVPTPAKPPPSSRHLGFLPRKGELRKTHQLLSWGAANLPRPPCSCRSGRGAEPQSDTSNAISCRALPAASRSSAPRLTKGTGGQRPPPRTGHWGWAPAAPSDAKGTPRVGWGRGGAPGGTPGGMGTRRSLRSKATLSCRAGAAGLAHPAAQGAAIGSRCFSQQPENASPSRKALGSLFHRLALAVVGMGSAGERSRCSRNRWCWHGNPPRCGRGTRAARRAHG